MVGVLSFPEHALFESGAKLIHLYGVLSFPEHALFESGAKLIHLHKHHNGKLHISYIN